ncbi:MAG: pyruvate kinase [Aerococcus sp.]|nr:pyruvate kinase [Aerococcus sp.]
MHKKTKIVCTIGPASESVEMLTALKKAGMNVARFNFSHGSHEEHLQRFKNVHEVEEQLGERIGIMLDTKGPEIRTNDMKDHQPVFLEEGSTVRVYMHEVEGDATQFSVTYTELIDDVEVGSTILVDDGLVELRVTGIDKADDCIITEVANSGIIKDKKGVNVPGVSINLPGITEKDADDIRFGLEQGIDYIAASFVRKAEDVMEIRKILEETGHLDVKILPKIESQEGVDNLDTILTASDGMMVARGDLGVEVPAEMVPIYQKEMIRKCNEAGKPVITATQMLDSMERNPRPTRAEASDVANAIFDGTDAIMLSGETAAGKYPVNAVQTMNRIALAMENEAQEYGLAIKKLKEFNETDASEAVAQSIAHTARNMGVKTIVAATESGYTARLISKYRPDADILALTFSESIAHKLLMSRGVIPFVVDRPNDTDEMMALATHVAKENGFASDGDHILIAAGVPVGETGMTNIMRIQTVGEELLQGAGIGSRQVIGHVLIADDPETALASATDQTIIVTKETNEKWNDVFEKAAGVIVEKGGLTGHAAVVSVNSDTPAIIGAEGATEKLHDDQLITLDTKRGVVYNGSSL